MCISKLVRAKINLGLISFFHESTFVYPVDDTAIINIYSLEIDAC